MNGVGILLWLLKAGVIIGILTWLYGGGDDDDDRNNFGGGYFAF
jgi:hypothetical protein